MKLPKVTCKQTTRKHTITLTCTTKGGSNVATMVRVRVFHGRQLVHNSAARVRSHKVRFTIRLGDRARSGKYTIRLAVDAGGQRRRDHALGPSALTTVTPAWREGPATAGPFLFPGPGTV